MGDTWVKAREAAAYYGISINTLYNWRIKGKIKSKFAPYQNTQGYEYYLDEELKNQIEFMKSVDNRWK